VTREAIPPGRGRATRRRLDDGRWHFQHGPIDCIVAVDGEPAIVDCCTEQAWQRFQGLLDELVAELPLLRADLSGDDAGAIRPRGSVARRMVAACRPYGEAGTFITAMAAVAGSVAEELIGFFQTPGIARASVNNGGDIALWLAPGSAYAVGICADPGLALAGGPLGGRFAVDAGSPVRGVATSGWRGRSFSLGIADSVTVLARSASAADAAATIIGNAVDVDAAGIVRRPACALRDDSDLGERLVTVAVPTLAPADVAEAMAAGAAVAGTEIAAGRIVAAAISLQGRFRLVEAAPSAAALSAAAGDASQPRFLRRDSQPTAPSPISISA
jgi:ApbE superfamily uncharacterized protein (UPF0280 family)